MLARYTMKRGARRDALPEGVRQDSRKHTRHPLRPPSEIVDALLAGDLTWDAFRDAYLAAVDARFAEDRAPFDALAARAREEDVHLGCSCPTKKNPDVCRCHTWLALEWMQARYPDLDVCFP